MTSYLLAPLFGKGNTDGAEDYSGLVRKNYLYFDIGDNSGPYAEKSVSLIGNTSYLATFYDSGLFPATLSIYLNGIDQNLTQLGSTRTRSNTTDPLTIGGSRNGSFFLNNKAQEYLFYFTDQSSNRSDIESNINNYYNIFPFDAYVETWYDQSGNGNHASQTTAANQPTIVTGSTVVVENGKPAIDFDGIDDSITATYTLGTDLTSVLVLKSNINTSTADGTIYQWNIDNDNHYAHGFRDGGLFTRIYKNSTINEENGYDFSSTSQFLSFNIYDYANATNTLYVDNILGTNINNGRSQSKSGSFIQIMARAGGAFPIDGKLSEIIFYPSDQSSNRTGIETDINSNYKMYWDGAFTSILNTYPDPVIAYGVTALSSTYLGPLVKVRRESDDAEQDINPDYYGNLSEGELYDFCSGSVCYVVAWYDQSGNNNNATSSIADRQPIIYSGSYTGDTMLFNQDYLTLSSSLSISDEFTYLANWSSTSPQTDRYGTQIGASGFYLQTRSGQRYKLLIGGDQLNFYVDYDQFIRYDVKMYRDSSNLITLLHDNVVIPSSVSSSVGSMDVDIIGRQGPSSYHRLEGTLNYVIIYDRDLRQE